MDTTANDPAQADQSVWIAPSLSIRIVSIAGPVALVAGTALLGNGQLGIAQFIAMVVLWVSFFVAMPPDRGEPECLADRSHIDWNAMKIRDMPGFILVAAFAIGGIGLFWYLDLDRRLTDLLDAILWTGMAAVQSAVLAYRVWWKRRLPG
jgi:hypothetical protein